MSKESKEPKEKKKPEEKRRPVARVDEIQEGEAHVVEVDGEEVLLTRHGGRICACGNSCTHVGASLSDGWIEDGHVVCPWHYAQFDLETGRREEPPAVEDLPRWETLIEGDQVFLGSRIQPKLRMPEGDDSRRILIVGGGAAGQAAAESLRRSGFAGRISIFSADSEAPYDRTFLSKALLAGKAPKEKLALRGADFYRDLEIDLRLNSRVVSVDPGAKVLELADGSRESGSMILLASGSAPRRLDVKGFEGPGTPLLRDIAQAVQLADELENIGTAVLIGAGFIALEAASSLRDRGVAVHIVAPEETAMERIFGTDIGHRIMEIHRAAGVEFHMGHSVREVTREEDSVTGVVLDNGKRIEAGLVLMAAGVSPVLDYLHGSGLVQDGAVPVNGRFETAEPGVFAAGDIALFPRAGGESRIEHWITAQKQGIHAAQAMLGSVSAYDDVPVFWTKQYAYSFKYTGYGEIFDQVVIHGSLAEDSWIAGYYRHGRLCGAATLGRGKALLALRDIMAAGGHLAPEDLAAGKFTR
jgi:NADPH-dependent 2,4-dienoyl-CoA reductase/sulfur reductase-like enzyme/nitrite reductase/ring-hydroxylating ferredoxin subunit